MDVYCSAQVKEALYREYHYVFATDKYPGVPQLQIKEITKEPFELVGTGTVIPVEVMHYKMPVLGFRFGDFAYITDANTVSNEEREKLKGVKILVVNALRREAHISHFNLEEALNFIDQVKPEKAFLTHISHLFGTHDEIHDWLPDNVEVAYDGLEIQF
jgi:phosphoribosyl 1,2-cyclic phosphate phosphodiesterase